MRRHLHALRLHKPTIPDRVAHPTHSRNGRICPAYHARSSCIRAAPIVYVPTNAAQEAFELTEGPAFPAAACLYCPVRFHMHSNFKCRRHAASWDADYGKWLCCNATDVAAPGCRIAEAHEPVPDG